MRPATRPTSPLYEAPPVPSTIRASRIIRSSIRRLRCLGELHLTEDCVYDFVCEDCALLFCDVRLHEYDHAIILESPKGSEVDVVAAIMPDRARSPRRSRHAPTVAVPCEH